MQKQKAVIYVRVSSREQKEEGYSIPAQRKLLTDFARTHSIAVVKDFEDDETAKSAGRTGFNEMINYIKAQKDVKTILVEKTDRLYRNFKDYIVIDDLGITVNLVKENEILGKDATSHQKFIHGIKVLMAKNYVDNLSEEVKKGLKQKAESGHYPCPIPPIGYRLQKTENKSIVVPDEKNSHIPIKMFNYYSTGLYSITSLIKKIRMEDPVIAANLPKSSKITNISKSSGQRILRNPIYYGDFYWKGTIYHGNHQPLISKGLWDKVQAMIDRFENKEMLSKYNTQEFLLKGLLTCGECGRTICGTRKHKGDQEYIYYACTKHMTNCSQHPVREQELEEQIIASLHQLIIPSDVAEKIATELKQSLSMKQNYERSYRERLTQEKTALEKKLSLLYEDRLNGVITLDFYNFKSKEYENQIRSIEDNLCRCTQAGFDYYQTGSKILEIAQKAEFLYQNASFEKKRELVNFLFSKSQLRDKKILISYKKPFDMVYQRVLKSDWRTGRDSNPRPLP